MRFYNGVRQPDADLLNRTDDIGHQLLGAAVDSQGREAPDGIDWPIREWAKQHHIPVTAYEHTVTE